LKYRVHVYDGSSPRFARVLSRQNSIPLSVLKERYEKQFGPNCHPYTHVGPPTLDPITCPLTMNDIHNALCRRVWLKFEKRFLEADSQLYELMTYGIEVNDDLKQWRSDGKAIFDKDWCRPPTQELTYKEITSLALPERTRVRIKQLVRQRAIALARRDVNLASALKYELAKTYRVVIDDFDLTWQVLSESDQLDIGYLSLLSHPLFHPAVTSHLPTSAGLDPEHNWTKGGAYRYNEMVSSGRTLSLYEQVRVVSLLMQRDELRSIGYYVEADSIVRELWSTYEVDIHDARRQYCVGKTFAEFDEQQTTENPNLAVSCSPESFHIQQEDVMRVETEPPRWWEAYKESGLSKTLDPNKAVEVENLIKYLSSQQQRNPNIVDRLIVRLEEEYGLLFDGTSWKLRSKILKYEPDSSKFFSLPNVGLNSIQELVDMRNEQLFHHKNTGMAEILEAGIRSKYNIVIDDENHTWYLVEN
jgi:hypothetical protein